MLNLILKIIFYFIGVAVYWIGYFAIILLSKRLGMRYLPHKESKDATRIAISKFLLTLYMLATFFSSLLSINVLQLLDNTLPWFPLLIFFTIQAIATFSYGKLQMTEMIRRTQFIGGIFGLILAAVAAYFIF